MGTDLVLDGVSVARGESTVVHEVSLVCPPGEVTVLLGANGAGKSSLLDAVAGVIPVSSGRILLGGRPMERIARDKRAAAGLAYVEQGRTIFGGLTVEENLAVVAGRRSGLDRAFELFPELEQRRRTAAQMLSGGEQQMLVLARAVISNPQVLLVDEMSQGLAPVVVKRLMPFVSRVAAEGVAVLLVEQFANLALRLGRQAHVLSVGRLVLSGSCTDLLERPDDVRRAYFAADPPPVPPGRGTTAATPVR